VTRKKYRGQFRKGFDPRRRRGFSTEECQRGWQSAVKKALAHSWHRYAWLYYKCRGWYRAKRRSDHGKSTTGGQAA